MPVCLLLQYLCLTFLLPCCWVVDLSFLIMFVILAALWLFLTLENKVLVYGQELTALPWILYCIQKHRWKRARITSPWGSNQELMKEWARNRKCDLFASVCILLLSGFTVSHLLSYTFHAFPSFIWTYCTYLHRFYMLRFEYFEHFQEILSILTYIHTVLLDKEAKAWGRRWSCTRQTYRKKSSMLNPKGRA